MSGRQQTEGKKRKKTTMKTKKRISMAFTSLFILTLSFTATKTSAQAKTDATMKDCCMMKDGKMMCMKDGKTMPMDKDMTMKNGTKCMTNGECIMKDGKKMKMKEGDCMDMDGKMDKCSMMGKEMKAGSKKKGDKKDMSGTYTCPMHPEVTSDKPGKCTKCGMDLVEKK
jgi:hypothetical protein